MPIQFEINVSEYNITKRSLQYVRDKEKMNKDV